MFVRPILLRRKINRFSMKKIPMILLLAFFAMPAIYGQVKIGDNPQAISPTSVLELESNDRVLVITRINTQQMDAIVPNQGAMVYNTDTQCIHYYDGTAWINLCAAAFEIPENSISTEHIVDFSINGVDIQNGSIGQGKLQDGSVTQEKLSENAVGAFALDNDNINLSDFNNDLNLLTLSTAAGNDIVNNGGVFYDDQVLQDNIAANTAFINGHITADADTNATNEIQSLTLTGNQLGISGSNTVTLPAGGNATDELITNAVLTGTDLVITEAGTIHTVPLGSLAGGGSQNLTNVLTQGNDAGTNKIIGLGAPTNPNDAATKAYVDANVGGNQNLAQVLAQGTDGGAALIQNILDPVDPQDAATRAYVLATVASGGNLTDGRILIGGAGDVAQQLAVGGDATLANDGTLTILNDVIDSGNILDAAILAEHLHPMGAAADGDNIQWNTTLNAGAGGWEVVAGGGGLENEQDIALNITTNTVDLLEDDGTTISSSVLLDGTTLEAINNGTDDVIQIADEAITLDKIAPPDLAGTPAPANGQVMVWDNDAGDWVIDAQAGAHTGTSKSLFFADVNGDPAQFFHPINGKPLLIWDYESRVVSGNAYGTLGIGLDDTTINKNVKVHIEDTDGSNVSYPLEVQNRTATAGSGVGILFASDTFNNGKGALVFERQGGFGVGDFHFTLNQKSTAPAEAPTLADAAFTIKNNKDIRLYGGIDVDGTPSGLGLNNQVLASAGPGNGVKWITGGAGEINTADNIGTLGVGPYASKNVAELQFKNINGLDANIITVIDDPTNNEIDLDIRDESIDATTKIQPLTPTPTANQMLITDTSGDVVWAPAAGHNGTAAGSIFFSGDATPFAPTEDNAQLFWDNTNDKLYVGPQLATTADVKLNVNGVTRTQGIKNSPGTSGLPSYRFTDDLDTGMYSDQDDELGFSVGGSEALSLDLPSAGNTNVIINQSLELEGVLLDGPGNPGTSLLGNNQVLSSTGTGVQWVDATMSSNGPTMAVARTGNSYTFQVGVITDANVSSNPLDAIDGSKINPDFGNQDVLTTGDFIDNGITIVAPDFVFQKYFNGFSSLNDEYEFKSLDEIESFVKQHNHLPGIKSAYEIINSGEYRLTESSLGHLEKIEELFLHTIEQENKIKSLRSENETLTDELNAIKKDLEEIKSMLKKSN